MTEKNADHEGILIRIAAKHKCIAMSPKFDISCHLRASRLLNKVT